MSGERNRFGLSDAPFAKFGMPRDAQAFLPDPEYVKRADYWALSETFRVDQYGAIGDGIADDTQPIQAAIDDASAAGGGVVFLKAGTYLVTGLTLADNVLLRGAAKRATIIKLAGSTNEHVVQAGDFDTNADGVSKATPVGCRSAGLADISIDGNKDNQTVAHHGLAYYGIDLYLENVEVKECEGWGIYCESPGATNSTTVGQNLQYSWVHVEAHDNDLGNITYNGQSDSSLLDIVCYETGGEGSGQTNFRVLSKGTGLRVVGIHCWGTSDYGISNEAATAGFTHAHVESADVAKVWMQATTYFDGRVYEAGSNNAAPGFLIANNVAFYNIRATVSAIDTAVSYASADGGNALIDIQHFSTAGGAALFSGTPSESNFIRARLSGNVTDTLHQFPREERWVCAPVKGADLASSATLSIGNDGNYFQVTGTTTITHILTTGWTSGNEITLCLAGACSMNHAAGGSGQLLLAGSVNYTTGGTANDMFRFVLDQGNWRELCRTLR